MKIRLVKIDDSSVSDLVETHYDTVRCVVSASFPGQTTREKVFADLDAKKFLAASGFSYFPVYAKFWQKDASWKDVATYEKAYVVLVSKRSDGNELTGKSEDLLKTAAELCGKTRFKQFMHVHMPYAHWYGASGEQMSDIQLVYMDNSVSSQKLLCVKEIYEVFFKESNGKGLSTTEFFMPKPCTGIGRCALNFHGETCMPDDSPYEEAEVEY